GLTIEAEGEVGAAEVAARGIIDEQYFAVAAKALHATPAELAVPPAAAERFEVQFGLRWLDALRAGVVYNAADGCAALGGGDCYGAYVGARPCIWDGAACALGRSGDCPAPVPPAAPSPAAPPPRRGSTPVEARPARRHPSAAAPRGSHRSSASRPCASPRRGRGCAARPWWAASYGPADPSPTTRKRPAGPARPVSW
ncbi:MAG: hypothetical protein VX152_12085, partial [Pseudomonadota bacterium]|nr:hypothetical protein [Pseudomonadota bacterium]